MPWNKCIGDAFDDDDFDRNSEYGRQRHDDLDDEYHPPVHCKRCGSTDVRWRRQTDKWVLFSTTPGVIHVCPINDPFIAVPE